MPVKQVLREGFGGSQVTQTLVTDDRVIAGTANNIVRTYTFTAAELSNKDGIVRDITISCRAWVSAGTGTIQFRRDQVSQRAFTIGTDSGDFYGTVIVILNPNVEVDIDIYTLDNNNVENVSITARRVEA